MLWKQRQTEFYEFEASLVYRVNSRTARAMERNPEHFFLPSFLPTFSFDFPSHLRPNTQSLTKSCQFLCQNASVVRPPLHIFSSPSPSLSHYHFLSARLKPHWDTLDRYTLGCFKIFQFFLNLCVYVYVHMCTMCTHAPHVYSTHRSQKASDPPELELPTVGSCLMWVLGIEPGSPGRAAIALNCRVVSPAPLLAPQAWCHFCHHCSCQSPCFPVIIYSYRF